MSNQKPEVVKETGLETPPDQNRSLVAVVGLFVTVFAICLSLFQLYTAGLTALTALVQRSVHLGAILTLCFLLRPPFAGARKDKFTVWFFLDLLLVLASWYVCLYISINLEAIFARQGDWLPADIYVGVIGIILVLEACRRVIGNIMMGICVVFLLYAWYGHGPLMPDIIMHKGYSIERMATTLWLTTEGVFGIPIGVAATFVFVFVLFGAFLEVTGGGNFFINLAYALTGRFSGGPAKTSVIASGFMGSVSGSAVGNVVATGSFTIPMMKRVGYKPHVAGAIEAAASTGGQLMPPIMGAGAFLMAEFTNTSYLEIIKIALVPAILYYFTVLIFVHFEAQKHGLLGQPKESLPKVGQTLVEGLHFLIPVGVLVYVLVENYSPMFCGFIAVISVVIINFVYNAVFNLVGSGEKSGWGKFLAKEGGSVLTALERGARNAIMVSVACAAAGIIVGTVTLTGMGLKFSSLVLELSGGVVVFAILLIGAASLVLGMGLPVTASYIVLATLAGPALLDMGVPLVVTHMIVFWYSQDANVTPPVSLASFAGAGVAGANPMQTAFVSWKLAKGLYIIPIVMAYRPLLGVGPEHDIFAWPAIQTMVACLLGLVSFAAALDRFLFRPATWFEVVLFVASAALLFWGDIKLGEYLVPHWLVDICGVALLALAVVLQKTTHRGWSPPTLHETAPA